MLERETTSNSVPGSSEPLHVEVSVDGPRQPGGRPTVFNEAIRSEICERLANGETIRQICKDAHMPAPSSVYLELVRNQSFSEQYAKARDIQISRWEEELLEIADNGLNDWQEKELESGRISEVPDSEHISRSRLRVDTRKWIMSKRLPKKYGDKVLNEHTGEDGEKIKSELTVIIEKV